MESVPATEPKAGHPGSPALGLQPGLSPSAGEDHPIVISVRGLRKEYVTGRGRLVLFDDLNLDIAAMQRVGDSRIALEVGPRGHTDEGGGAPGQIRLYRAPPGHWPTARRHVACNGLNLGHTDDNPPGQRRAHVAKTTASSAATRAPSVS